jgi:hypothetical protein
MLPVGKLQVNIPDNLQLIEIDTYTHPVVIGACSATPSRMKQVSVF